MIREDSYFRMMRTRGFKAYIRRKKETKMKRIVLTFGLIAGVIVAVLGAINMSLWRSGALDFDSGQLVGYTSMIIALSMVFFGIKSFRDKHQNGIIKFGKAFTVGILITLLASAVYVAGWEVYWRTNDELRTTFMPQYMEHTIEKMKSGGATAEDIEATRKQMMEFAEMYDITAIRLAITLVEILPVGLVITLISAAILRRREVLAQ